jgi:hypothetical protein
MKTIFCFMIILSCFVFSSTASDNNPQRKDGKGRVVGKVVDIDESPIPDATVTLKGSAETYKTTTDRSGEFSIELPQGTYSMIVWRSHFYESERSKFAVNENEIVKFNFQLIFYELAKISRIKNNGQQTQACTCSFPLKTEKLSVASLKDTNEFFIQ